MSILPRLPASEPPWGFIQVAWQQLVEAVEALQGVVAYEVTSQSAAYSEDVTSGEKIILASGTFTISLPTAVGNDAKITVKLISAGTVTIDPDGTETIDGAGSASIAVVNDKITIVSDGANWQTI